MVQRDVNRLGALIGGGFIALVMGVSTLEAQRPAGRRSTPAPRRVTPAPRPITPPPANPKDASITVTGCLLLGPYGDFTISKTVAEPGAILNSVAWKLEGSKALLGHVLEKVEVTGTMLPMPPDKLRPVVADTSRPADPAGAASYLLRVKTIKKLAGGCS
jgi:hypothetical protein